MQVGRTHKNCVGFFGFGHELVTVAKGNLAVFRDVVDGFDIAHGNLLLDYRTRMPNPTEVLDSRRPWRPVDSLVDSRFVLQQ